MPIQSYNYLGPDGEPPGGVLEVFLNWLVDRWKSRGLAKVKRNVLVMHDDIRLCRMIKRHLQRSGYLVMTSPDCKAAAEMLATTQTDLLVLDVELAHGEAFDAIKRLIRGNESRRIPVVALTQKPAEQETLENLHGCRVDARLEYPMNLTVLTATVKRLLGDMPEPPETALVDRF